MNFSGIEILIWICGRDDRVGYLLCVAQLTPSGFFVLPIKAALPIPALSLSGWSHLVFCMSVPVDGLGLWKQEGRGRTEHPPLHAKIVVWALVVALNVGLKILQSA